MGLTVFPVHDEGVHGKIGVGLALFILSIRIKKLVHCRSFVPLLSKIDFDFLAAANRKLDRQECYNACFTVSLFHERPSNLNF